MLSEDVWYSKTLSQFDNNLVHKNLGKMSRQISIGPNGELKIYYKVFIGPKCGEIDQTDQAENPYKSNLKVHFVCDLYIIKTPLKSR